MVGSPDNQVITCEFFPQWPRNPYHRLLIDALKANHVAVGSAKQLKDLATEMAHRKWRPDIVHIHAIPRFSPSPWEFGRNILFYLRLWKLRQAGSKIIWTIHDLFPHESKWKAIDIWFGRMLATHADHCLLHGPSALRLLHEKWRMRRLAHFTTIWHGHYADVYPNNITRELAREKLGINQSSFVYLFLGLIRAYKGLDVLLRAFRTLARPDAILLIAGRTVDLDICKAIQTGAQEDSRIRFFPGYVEDDDVQLYMNAADIVVFPYRDSTLTSGAAILAMSFKKPCIAPRLGSMQDILDAAGGFLLPAATDEAVAVALQEAYKERDRLPEMGDHNYDKVLGWSWETLAAATVNVYRLSLDAVGTVRTVPSRNAKILKHE